MRVRALPPRLHFVPWLIVASALVAVDHLSKLQAQARYLLEETPGSVLDYRAGGQLIWSIRSTSLPHAFANLLNGSQGPSLLNIEATYTRNAGVMGGMLEQYPNLIRGSAFHGLSLIGLVLFAFGWRKLKSGVNKAACLFLACGIVGNFLDRARFTFVIDWIYVTGRLLTIPIEWPVFNFADVFIGWGIALFILAPLLNRLRPRIAPQNLTNTENFLGRP